MKINGIKSSNKVSSVQKHSSATPIFPCEGCMIVTSVWPHLFPVVKSRDEANLDRVANKRGSGGPRVFVQPAHLLP